jgi:hypothetical protein
MDDTNAANSPIPFGKLAWGIAMLVVGILAFTDAIDMFDIRDVWRFWPLLLIFIGLSSEIDSLRQRTNGGGYLVVAVGVWMLAGNHDLLGLNHRTAFPLGIAVAGLGVILHALVDAPTMVRKEKSNDRS